jgi:hypothetical protein
MKLSFASVLLCILMALSAKGQDSYLSVLDDRSNRIDTTYWVNVQNILAYDSVYGWKEWQLVENFTFGKDRGSLQMITDLNALHPYFRDKIIQLINNCAEKGIQVLVVESYRTKAKQAEYFGMGRKYTRSAGGKSKHQYGLACDVVPVINGVAQWDDLKLWRKVGLEGEKLGLRWGGRWRHPFDPAHFEWTAGVTTAQLSVGYFPKPATTRYPCLMADLQQLQKYWNAWEAEQAVQVTTKKVQAIASGQRP